MVIEPVEGPVPFVLILQTDRTSALATVIVAPVTPRRLTPLTLETDLAVEINGGPFIVRMHELATVRRTLSGEKVADAAELEPVGKTLDILLFGS